LRLEQNVFPWLGRLPLASVTAPMILECLRWVGARGTVETAHRVKHACGQVFRYGIATGHGERNPAADLLDALRPVMVEHRSAITDPVRVGEIWSATWAEFDLAAATWLIPSHRMKRNLQGKATGPDHVVPLSGQAVAVLRGLQPLTGSGLLVFPGFPPKSLNARLVRQAGFFNSALSQRSAPVRYGSSNARKSCSASASATQPATPGAAQTSSIQPAITPGTGSA
jgi:integrase